MRPPSSPDSGAVAVVGVAGRFPGARDVGEFWRNLCEGRESVVRYADGDLLAAGEDPALLADPSYVRAGAPLDGTEHFDAGFFGFSARDAAILDPQHRHFLEVCWEALEDAGHVPESFPGAIGVFAGSGMQAYFTYHLAPNRALMRDVGPFLVRHTGNDKDFLTTGVSYRLNLTGPSIGIQTACSTSLVAVHLAAQSLLSGECDMALAGGVSIELPARLGYLHRPGEVASPDGRCRPFDRAAAGTVFGSGAGVAVLRRAEDAIADGDHVYALIRGSAVNNDGRGKVSYLAPSLDGQAGCAAEALAVAGVPAASIGYVEAHGTGTAVGDPIEVAALTQAYRFDAASPWRCGIGSVKSNIGHLDVAAGIASFIKAVLSLRHGVIPASLHFTSANPDCRFEQGPFRVVAAATPWPRGASPRRAAVNSLGVGGTNAHVVLEEAPARPAAAGGDRPHLLCLSARSPAALGAAAVKLAAHLRQHPDAALADVAFTLQVGRRAFAYRRAVVCRDAPHAIAQLTEAAAAPAATPAGAAPPVVFMFPGGGNQYPNMARQLHEREPLFKQHLDEVLDHAEHRHGRPVRRWLFPAPHDARDAATSLDGAVPSLLGTFAVEYAMARYLRARGVEPAALVGHSLGEVVAACLAGVFTLADAVTIVVARADVLERLPAGATTAVALPEAELAPLLSPGVSLAAVNGPALCVVSGAIESVAGLEALLATRNVEVRRLRLSFAAHSSLLDGALDGFARAIAGVRFAPPSIPIVANVTGQWADGDVMGRADYWVRQLRETVRFADGVARAVEGLPGCVLLETGPGTTLTTLAGQYRGPAGPRAIVAAMPHRRETTPEPDALLSALGRLWTAGVALDWARHPVPGQRISLPAYPFEHARHWIERPSGAAAEAEPTSPPARSPSPDDWLSVPTWQPAARQATIQGAATWLAFDPETAVTSAVVAALRARGDHVVLVVAGRGFAIRDDGSYVIRPGDRDDCDRLLTEVAASGLMPTRIAHLWGLAPPPAEPLDAAVDESFLTPLFVVQAWDQRHPGRPLHVAVVTAGLQRVADERITRPELALGLGPALVVPREYDGITCAHVDWTADAAAVEDLVDELRAATPAPVTAWRGGRRWVPARTPYRPPRGDRRRGLVQRHGVYLVTGGFGSLGLAVAEHLAGAAAARLVLVGRRGAPDRRHWSSLLERDDEAGALVRRLLAIERAGGSILPLRADVADAASMAAVVDTAIATFGAIDGIFHAAGVLDDQAIAVKTRESAAAVLRPKLFGARVLDAVVARTRPRFVVHFSSVSGQLGVPGQVDYTAANAYLDACAQAGIDGATHVVAIDWAAWRDTGMTAALLAHAGGADVAHPLLGRRREAGAGRIVYEASCRAGASWVLDEHRIDGEAVLPATGFLDLLRAAAAVEAPGAAAAVVDLVLLTPVVVPDGERRDVRLELRTGASPQTWMATISSRADAGDEWTENARGRVTTVAPPPPRRLDLDALEARCATRTAAGEPGWRSPQHRHLHVGGRWRCLRRVRAGAGEALVDLRLPDAYATDLATFSMHPALLDQAITGALTLLSEDEIGAAFFVPMACERVTAWRRLPSTLRVHVRRLASEPGTVAFDLLVADEAGEPCVAVERMTLASLASTAALGDHRVSGVKAAEPHAILDTLLAGGLDTEDGLAALDAILATPGPARVVVSPIPLDELERRLSAPRRRAAAAPAAVRRRPRSAAEAQIAATWATALGLAEVGIDDNWFELGGHSLLGIRVLAQLRRAFQVELPPRLFFDAPTVAGQAAVVERAGRSAPAAASGPVRVDRSRFRRAQLEAKS